MSQAILRPPTEQDRAFIMNSWLKSVSIGDVYTYIHPSVFYSNHRALIERCLEDSFIICACDPKDPNHLFGFIVFQPKEQKIIHCIYVKRPFRNFGIGRQLVEAAFPDYTGPLTLTHLDRINFETDRGRVKRRSVFIAQRQRWQLNYNPYLFYYGAK